MHFVHFIDFVKSSRIVLVCCDHIILTRITQTQLQSNSSKFCVCYRPTWVTFGCFFVVFVLFFIQRKHSHSQTLTISVPSVISSFGTNSCFTSSFSFAGLFLRYSSISSGQSRLSSGSHVLSALEPGRTKKTKKKRGMSLLTAEMLVRLAN